MSPLPTAPSRRTLTKGLAWAAPTVALANATPAYAVSVAAGPIAYNNSIYQEQAQDCGVCSPPQADAYYWAIGWSGAWDCALTNGGSWVEVTGPMAGDVISNVSLYFPYRCAHTDAGMPITWIRGSEGPGGHAGWSDPILTADLDGMSNSLCSPNYTISGNKALIPGGDHFMYKIVSTRTWTLGVDILQCAGNPAWIIPDWVRWTPEALTCGGGHQDTPSWSRSDTFLTLAVNGVQLPVKATQCQEQSQACNAG